jgi:hypothetical protein
MLVYGDQREMAEPSERLSRIEGDLAVVASMRPGLERHAKLVGALIEAGRLLQGAADAGLESMPLEELVHGLAQAVVRSVDSGFREIGELPGVPAMDLRGPLELRVPEGFAFYALYPEAYVAAARKLKVTGAPRVIGIRSIGTSLGAVVACALGAPRSLSVRPFGEPFARQVELPAAEIDRDAYYVVVDEGPGLSGSSFGAVADALEAQGISPDRIAFLPSHAGELGERASPRHRARWGTAQRVVAEFDPQFLVECFGALEPLSSGGPWERLKFLARDDRGRLLLKFAGLGAIGERKLEMARALHARGFAPEPLGLVHGFLVERWQEDGRALAADDRPVREIGHYVGTRARVFPATDESGAGLPELLAMSRRNLSLALGEEAARAVEPWAARLAALQVQRVSTDNKLDREEWLRLPGGALLKTDAVDHHCGHDLIGCQDMAWDLAGAIVEFGLSEEEMRELVHAAEFASGRRPSPALIDFCRLAYSCFRLGQAALATELRGEGGSDCDVKRYVTAVIPLLFDDYCCFSRRESSLD